ncbi:hypothetical protein BIW11_01453 [Tropilaelaps mercedesae]|uniref:Uncharacterized protein n=1 Tax=Tropilaelaps mercedesae TaxID=418985 RepID=A0A1V9XE67_9ACAR|nr:hypothetical protein BIW11_01453 [Tropilaelaps mercedesae]
MSSSSTAAGPSRRANIIRLVPQTSGFADAFRKLVSRALCVQLPTPEWTVGYYKNPLNPVDKVLVFSSSATSPVKCLIVREDMSCVETVGGFRRDRVALERVMSSLHLERILQGLHSAAAQTKQVERVELPSDALIEQKKTVQRFRTRLRVHLCRAKQSLKKAQQQNVDVEMADMQLPSADNENTATADGPVEERVRHNDVWIAFEHGGTRYSILLDKLYQLPPPIFQGAMRVMAGPATGPIQASGSPIRTAQESTSGSCLEKRRKLDVSPSDQEQMLSTMPQPISSGSYTYGTSNRTSEKSTTIEDRHGPHGTTPSSTCMASPHSFGGILLRDSHAESSGPVQQTHFINEHTMVLQIEQVLNDGRLETRKIYVNGAPDALTIFQEGGAPLPRHLQDAIQQLLTNPNGPVTQPQQQPPYLPPSATSLSCSQASTADADDAGTRDVTTLSTDPEFTTRMEDDDEVTEQRCGSNSPTGVDAPPQIAEEGATSVQTSVVVDLGDGLPSEHAGLPLEAMQLQIDAEEQL